MIYVVQEFKSVIAYAEGLESSQLLRLMDAMITCLESHRRDELEATRSKQLHRFIKRMRKAGYDLKNIL